ncbi:MAG: GTPase Era [Alphaproteobacteria bacterium]
MNNADTRAGFVALIGAPNAGKSTLLNQLVGAKVSIVTHKVQTTRARIRGVALAGQSQIIFVDTPGIFKPKSMMDRAMVETAWGEAGEGDVTLLLVDAMKGITKEVDSILNSLADRKTRHLSLVLNKVDKVQKEDLLGLTATLNERITFEKTYMVSALKGDGIKPLLNELSDLMPSSPWLYPEDQLSDLPMKLAAAEVTREKLFMRLHQELPYASSVETEAWTEHRDGSVRIDQIIYVMRDNQKAIVLGKGGQTIKAIGAAARAELEEMLEQRVHLFIQVKVRANWTEERARLREIGLDMDQ